MAKDEPYNITDVKGIAFSRTAGMASFTFHDDTSDRSVVINVEAEALAAFEHMLWNSVQEKDLSYP